MRTSSALFCATNSSTRAVSPLICRSNSSTSGFTIVSERINLFRRHAELESARLEKHNALQHPSHAAAEG